MYCTWDACQPRVAQPLSAVALSLKALVADSVVRVGAKVLVTVERARLELAIAVWNEWVALLAKQMVLAFIVSVVGKGSEEASNKKEEVNNESKTYMLLYWR